MIPQSHVFIIQLAVAYTLLGAFIFTVAITCLSLIGFVKFTNQSQQNKLFSVLIIEIIVIGVGYFGNILKYNPSSVATETVNTAVKETRSIVYIQIPTESIKEQVKGLQDFLQKKGYIAPGTEVVGPNASPPNSEIRYFYPDQQELAKQLQSDLVNFGLRDFGVRYVQGYEGKAPRNVIEIWFKKST
jgi:hypothetical protein